MKKSYIKIMAAAASVFLFACCQENEIDLNGPAGKVAENSIAFAIGSPSTRSAVAVSDITQQGAVISLGTDENGTSFYLEESVIDLNSPITRGTPVYTENVFKMYPTLYAHSALETIKTGGDVFTYDESTGYYSSILYGTNIWDKGEIVGTGDNQTKQLKFWMYMPSDLKTKDYITTGPTFGGEASGAQTISFGYKSPATAADQEDIIFSARAVTEAEYNSNEKVVDVLFHHALTGVKFAIGNEDNITISEVSFSGLYDRGSCTVTPTTENDLYKDNITNHSSTVKTVVAWSDTSTTGTVISSGEFGTPVTYGTGEGEVKDFGANGKYPTSFAQAGNKNNLNDAKATQTFWLIPQTLTDNVKLTIVYYVGDVKEENKNEWTVDFGTALAKPYWKAGQIRTYTLKIDAVKVHIEDTITSGQKNGVTITNTGNTKAFIRATIIGNWCAENGEAVFGYTDFVDNPGEYVEIDSWTVDNPDGTFAGLPGNGWVRAKDGYFYYTTAVEPGQATGTALFTSYTPPTDHPDYQIAGKYVDTHFVMEIATQAVNANKNDGTTMTWQEAWKEALGTAPATN